MKNEGHASIYARWFILPTLISVYFAFPNLPQLNIPSEWCSWIMNVSFLGCWAHIQGWA